MGQPLLPAWTPPWHTLLPSLQGPLVPLLRAPASPSLAQDPGPRLRHYAQPHCFSLLHSCSYKLSPSLSLATQGHWRGWPGDCPQSALRLADRPTPKCLWPSWQLRLPSSGYQSGGATPFPQGQQSFLMVAVCPWGARLMREGQVGAKGVGPTLRTFKPLVRLPGGRVGL